MTRFLVIKRFSSMNVLKKIVFGLFFQLICYSAISGPCLPLTNKVSAELVVNKQVSTEILHDNRLFYADSFCIDVQGDLEESYFLYPFENRTNNFKVFRRSSNGTWIQQEVSRKFMASFTVYELDLAENSSSYFKVTCDLQVPEKSVPLVIRKESSLLYKSGIVGITNGLFWGIYITFLISILLLCFVIKKIEFWLFVVFNYLGVLLIVLELGYLDFIVKPTTFIKLPIILVAVGTGQVVTPVLCLYYYFKEDFAVKGKRYFLSYLGVLVFLTIVFCVFPLRSDSSISPLYTILNLNFLLVTIIGALVLVGLLIYSGTEKARRSGKVAGLSFVFYAVFAHVAGGIIYLLSRFNEYYLEFAFRRRINWIWLPDNYSFPLVYMIGIIIEILFLSALVYKQYLLLVKRNYLVQQELAKTKQEQGLKVLAGIEQEKIRLAKELHDSIGVKLTMLKMNFMSQEGKIKLNGTDFQNAITNIEEAYTNNRFISQILCSPFVQQFGLVDYMESELRTLISVLGKENVDYEIDQENISLSKDLQIIVHRLISELFESEEIYESINGLSFHILVLRGTLIIRYNYFITSDSRQFISLLERLTKDHHAVLQVLDGGLNINPFSERNVEITIKLNPGKFDEFLNSDKTRFDRILNESDGIFNP